MEKAWDDVLQMFKAQGITPNRPKPAQDSINCWVGYCGMPSTSANLRTVLSFDPRDHKYTGVVQSRRDAYGVNGLWEITKVIEVVDTGTYRPIYDWCMCAEHTRPTQA